MPPLERIDSRPELSQQVYQQLLAAICEGRLAPGARVTQEELAESLNVSRQPVHQALRLLKNDGFVVDAGRRGLMVAPLDGAALEQLYQVRAVLDGLAARLAAHSGKKLDPALIARGRKAAAAGKVGAMIEADMHFHQCVYQASGNPLIAQSAGRHLQHISRAMGVALGRPQMQGTVWDEHETILEAINAGDAARAEALARRHCEGAGKILSTQLQATMRKEATR
ncbi:MAG TPA: GntR family transcriptional regulator [Burkholderiales bacterium]|jgi:DNA-binding GntR family transcriptional regulator